MEDTGRTKPEDDKKTDKPGASDDFENVTSEHEKTGTSEYCKDIGKFKKADENTTETSRPPEAAGEDQIRNEVPRDKETVEPSEDIVNLKPDDEATAATSGPSEAAGGDTSEDLMNILKQRTSQDDGSISPKDEKEEVISGPSKSIESVEQDEMKTTKKPTPSEKERYEVGNGWCF